MWVCQSHLFSFPMLLLNNGRSVCRGEFPVCYTGCQPHGNSDAVMNVI